MAIGERTFHLAVMANYLSKKDQFDLFIQPKKLADFGLFNMSQGKDIFNAGYEYTMRMFEENKIKL